MELTDLSLRDRALYNTLWWGITLGYCFYLIPAILLCIINPIWFIRQDCFDAVHNQMNNTARWRKRKLEFIVGKYRVFNILKGE